MTGLSEMSNQNSGSVDPELLMKCVNFAAIKHKDQRRMDPEKTPYINHPIGKKKAHLFL